MRRKASCLIPADRLARRALVFDPPLGSKQLDDARRLPRVLIQRIPEQLHVGERA